VQAPGAPPAPADGVAPAVDRNQVHREAVEAFAQLEIDQDGGLQAVERAHREGVLTAASLMVGAPAAADAVERARRLPTLRVGLHLVVVEGRPLLPASELPDLVDGQRRAHLRLDGLGLQRGVERAAGRRDHACPPERRGPHLHLDQDGLRDDLPQLPRAYQLPFTVLRYGIPSGPRMREEPLIPIFLRKALRGEPLTVAGECDQYRKFVYVRDLADAHLLAMDDAAANETYNLEGSRKITVFEVAERIRSLVGEQVKIEVDLVLPPGPSAREVDDAIDRSPHECESQAERAHAAAHLEVLDQELCQRLEAPDRLEGRAAERDGGAQAEGRGAGLGPVLLRKAAQQRERGLVLALRRKHHLMGSRVVLLEDAAQVLL